MADAATVRRRAAADDLDGAAAALRQALAHAERRGRERLAWARLAEEIGCLDIARAELRTGLEEAPGDADLRAELEALLEELGDAGEPPPDTPADPLLQPADADLVRFVHLFAGREGVHARQWYDTEAGRGGYSPIHAPLTPALARAHLTGSVTLGTYVVRLDDTVTFFVVDLDLTRRALDHATQPAEAERLRQLVDEHGRELQAALASLGLPTLLLDSGFKGRHLWGFLADPLPTEILFHLGRALRRHLTLPPELHAEFFPKQKSVAPDALGNLVKLPLGVHRRSKRRGAFLDAAGPIADPWPLLRDPPRIARAQVLEALAMLRGAPEPSRPPEAPEPPAAPPSLDDALAHRDLAPIIGGCAVVRALVERARAERRLTHDEQVVLAHSLGHHAAGVEALNLLFEQCPEVPRHAFLQRPQRGHPISCARVRARIPETTSRLPCHCDFSTATLAQYPSPLLYRLPEED